jgi:hypothetical protein
MNQELEENTYAIKRHLHYCLCSKSRSSGTPKELKQFTAEIKMHMLHHAAYKERKSNIKRW